MPTAREEASRLADLLRSERHALAEFLIALAAFDRDRRWEKLGYSGLFPFLTRELRLSNGAAQNRKTAAELIQRFPPIEAALRSGDLCLSSVNELAKVITPENAPDVLPRFYGKSARDAAFVAAAIRPVENPPERFVVTPVRAAALPPCRRRRSRGATYFTRMKLHRRTSEPRQPLPWPRLRPARASDRSTRSARG